MPSTAKHSGRDIHYTGPHRVQLSVGVRAKAARAIAGRSDLDLEGVIEVMEACGLDQRDARAAKRLPGRATP